MVHEKKLERSINGKYKNCLTIVSVYLTFLTVYKFRFLFDMQGGGAQQDLFLGFPLWQLIAGGFTPLVT